MANEPEILTTTSTLHLAEWLADHTDEDEVFCADLVDIMSETKAGTVLLEEGANPGVVAYRSRWVHKGSPGLSDP